MISSHDFMSISFKVLIFYLKTNFWFYLSISVWPANTNPQSGGGPGAASTPNLPTSTPTHQPSKIPVVISQQQQQQRPLIQVAKMTSEETSLSSSSNLILNGSSNQLAKAEEKIQGRGMSRSNASYGIQQLLQEQASVHYDLLISIEPCVYSKHYSG